MSLSILGIDPLLLGIDPLILVGMLIVGGMIIGSLLILKPESKKDILMERLREDEYAIAFEKTRERTKRAQESQYSFGGDNMIKQYMEEFQTKLVRADIEMSATGFIVMFNVSALLVSAVGSLRFGLGTGAALLAGYGLAFFIFSGYLRRRENRKMRAFLLTFPSVLDFIIRGVRSGLPLATQVHLIADNFEDPISSLFRKVSSFVMLGMGVDEALRRVGEEMRLIEFRLFITAISVQQQAGGNISESLSRLADMMRKRIEINEKLKSQTSQIRASGYVVFAMPLAVFGLVSLLQPGYFDPLFNTELGNYMLMAAGGLIVMAITTMNIIMKERF